MIIESKMKDFESIEDIKPIKYGASDEKILRHSEILVEYLDLFKNVILGNYTKSDLIKWHCKFYGLVDASRKIIVMRFDPNYDLIMDYYIYKAYVIKELKRCKTFLFFNGKHLDNDIKDKFKDEGMII